jgi:hypothetical protein
MADFVWNGMLEAEFAGMSSMRPRLILECLVME